MDVSYQYLTFFMEDDARLEEIRKVIYLFFLVVVYALTILLIFLN